MPLNNVQVKSAKGRESPNRLAGGIGMYLEVRSTAQNYFRYRYRIDGKENTSTIGQYPEKSLALAPGNLIYRISRTGSENRAPDSID